MNNETFKVDGKTLKLGQRVHYSDMANNCDAYIMGVGKNQWVGDFFEMITIDLGGKFVNYDTSKLRGLWVISEDIADEKLFEVLVNVFKAEKEALQK